MTDACSTVMFVQVFCDRLVWFMVSGDELRGRGSVQTYEQLRLAQLVAGVLEVVLHREGDGFHLPASLTHGGEWRIAGDEERAELQKFFAQAAREISGVPSGGSRTKSQGSAQP